MFNVYKAFAELIERNGLTIKGITITDGFTLTEYEVRDGDVKVANINGNGFNGFTEENIIRAYNETLDYLELKNVTSARAFEKWCINKAEGR